VGGILAQAAFAAGGSSAGAAVRGCFLGRAEEMTASRE